MWALATVEPVARGSDAGALARLVLLGTASMLVLLVLALAGLTVLRAVRRNATLRVGRSGRVRRRPSGSGPDPWVESGRRVRVEGAEGDGASGPP